MVNTGVELRGRGESRINMDIIIMYASQIRCFCKRILLMIIIIIFSIMIMIMIITSTRYAFGHFDLNDFRKCQRIKGQDQVRIGSRTMEMVKNDERRNGICKASQGPELKWRCHEELKVVLQNDKRHHFHTKYPPVLLTKADGTGLRKGDQESKGQRID